MAIWTEAFGHRIEWRGPTSHRYPGALKGHSRGLVEHIASGFYEGTISWQKGGSPPTSSHWIISRDGKIAQMLDTDDASWAQGPGNTTWHSVENEGFGVDDGLHSSHPGWELLTAAQIEANAALFAKGHLELGWQLQPASSPAGWGLGYHSMGAPAWGHGACPGPAIKAQLPAIVARAAQILNGNTGDAEGDDQMKTMLVMLKGGDGAVWLSNGLTRYHVGDHTTTDLTVGGEAVLRDVRYVSGAQLLGSLVSTDISVVGDLDAFGAEVPADLAARLGGVTSGGAPTQEQVNAAVLNAMLDPQVQKGIGDAIASHLHVS